ncbi:MAG: acyltransferase [Candidatus Eremiobacteraeota bacterium]|nr:acyltransferase [Candidatus Eremiobacteraeota bacterium]MBC5803112.1 acyltransferase [Candidatus Eremiobacteraeota bacterium]MBC5821719.1 acyltransferase [Candidatus Eremiobacteraeota bacterium]
MEKAAEAHLAYVDGLRAVAVLAVVACHSGAASFGAAAGWRVCGARGVDLFFVISGFCLAYPTLARVRTGAAATVRFLPFLRRRVVRLAPSYYVAIVLFALLGMTSFGFPTAPAGHALGEAAQWREVLSDLSFTPSTQSIYDATFWTLGLEMQWYVVFPLLIALYVRSRALFGFIGVGCYLAYMGTHLVPPIVGTLPCFMLGMLAADVQRARVRIPTLPALLVVALLLAAATAAQLAHPSDVDHGDPLWHAAVFALALAAGSGMLRRVLSARPFVAVGTRSYSIYLVHAPVLAFLGHAGCPWPLAALLAVVLGMGYWLIVERPLVTNRMRALLEGLPQRLDTYVSTALVRRRSSVV